jgi:nitronate monooxygenase
MGADLAYMGSAFIATTEANATEAYKQMIVDSAASDIVYSNLFTGVHGNYLKGSIAAAGLDPDNLPESDPSKMSFGGGEGSKAKAWKEIWGAGQGVGSVHANTTKQSGDCAGANPTRAYRSAGLLTRTLLHSLKH